MLEIEENSTEHSQKLLLSGGFRVYDDCIKTDVAIAYEMSIQVKIINHQA